MRLGCGIGVGFGGGAFAPPVPMHRFNFDPANVTKDGSNNLASITNLGTNAVTSMTQGVSARKPLWVDAGSPNGSQPIGRFAADGTNAKYFGPSAPSGTYTAASGYTLYVVMRITSGTGYPWQYNTGSSRGGWLLSNTGGNRQLEARTSAGTVKTCTFGAYTLGTWEIQTIQNWGGGSDDVDATPYFSARVNGVAQTVSGSPWFWVPTSHSMYVSSAVATAHTVEIADLFAYADQHSLALRQQMEKWLGSRYGITVT